MSLPDPLDLRLLSDAAFVAHLSLVFSMRAVASLISWWKSSVDAFGRATWADGLRLKAGAFLDVYVDGRVVRRPDATRYDDMPL